MPVKTIEKGVFIMSQSELLDLIQFHKDGIAQHRLCMTPTAIYLEEQTIKALEELNRIKEGSK